MGNEHNGSERKSSESALSPSQQDVLDRILALWPCSTVFSLWARPGMGRTSMIRELATKLNGSVILQASDWFADLDSRNPLQLEEAFVSRSIELLKSSPILLVDDFDRFMCAVANCNFAYPRQGLNHSALLSVLNVAANLKRRIVFASEGQVGEIIWPRCLHVGFSDFEPADYAFFLQKFLGEKANGIDLARVFGFAPRLTVHQLKGCLDVLRERPSLTTEDVLEYLEKLKMASNVDVGAVRHVELDDLKGVDNVLESLKRYVVTPMIEDELARSYKLRPKRGILLYGPPGTGKTTVGRALAKRLRSKFFRIDGTFISGTRDYYDRIRQVFEGAKDNAPSVVFIDDCDTIFEEDQNAGLYRYLLTLMDGLESEGMSAVTVMMTAMDAACLPPALIRSGRVELWLEMKRPDRDARLQILSARMKSIPEGKAPKKLDAVAEATEGFTGADLERLVEDAKALMLEADVLKASPGDTTEFFLEAALEVKRNVDVIEQTAQAAEERSRFQTRDPFARYQGVPQQSEPPPSS
jgi:transitional endoplasmic reticulum ATPase